MCDLRGTARRSPQGHHALVTGLRSAWPRVLRPGRQQCRTRQAEEASSAVGRKQGIRPVRLVKLIGLVGLVALLASGCTGDQALHFGWPQAITPQGTRMRDFWMWAGFASLA